MSRYFRLIMLILGVFTFNMPLLRAQESITISVSGACGMCKERIETTSLSIIGVSTASYDIDEQTLTIETQPMFLKNDLVNALLALGHDADGKRADDKVYEALHACCKYRDIDGDAKVLETEEHTDHDGHDHSGHVHTEGDGHDHGKVPATNELIGTVFEKVDNGAMLPLIGANIRWKDSKEGAVTDLSGVFTMQYPGKNDYLIVSYVGYSPDTILITKPGKVNIVISSPNLLDAVVISHKKRSTEISYLETVKVHQISSKELLKAACCNLAESFDTTPAIDASSTDAVTGTRKIEMLGLAGPYVQITRENMPDVRGLAALQGLSFTPGPWVEGMQLNMGAGSVVNGFESITGQINVELKKPCHNDKMYLNAYVNQSARLEMNTFSKNEINDRWSTAILLHASTRNLRQDNNEDGFLDMPLGKQFSFINRWKWTNNNGQEGQVGMKLTFADNVSGEKDFDPIRSVRNQSWGADMTTNRAEVWAKRGFVNLDTPYKTLGFQFSGVYHDQKSQFGMRRYDATQKSLYFNMIYQTIIDNTDHQVRMGTSFQYDSFHENVIDHHYLRNEWVPGVFGEYTYKGSEKFSVLVGGRADYHNNYGLFFTPRLNVRFAPNESTVFRIAAGRGQKTASIFAENIGVFASSREIIVEGGDKNSTPYGLDAEVAWNVGFSVTKELKLGSKILALSADFNRIDFANQIILDLDRSARQVVFYNLKGKSYSNSFQLQAENSPTEWLDIRVAYRYNDVKTTYGENLLRKPLVSPQRAFTNLALHPSKGWTVDYTINWLSSVRLPSTADNNAENRLEENSPSYFLSNVQVSKSWKNNFEVYLGGENIGNFKLDRPIISSDSPFSPYFDSSLAWGPIMGMNIFAGVRFSLK